MAEIDDSEGFWTSQEMQELFRVTRQTVTRWARTRQGLAVTTLGGHWRFSRAYVRRWKEELANGQ